MRRDFNVSAYRTCALASGSAAPRPATLDLLALCKVRHAGRLQHLPQQRCQLAVPQPRGLYARLQRGAIRGCAPAGLVHPWRAWQHTRSGNICISVHLQAAYVPRT